MDKISIFIPDGGNIHVSPWVMPGLTNGIRFNARFMEFMFKNLCKWYGVTTEEVRSSSRKVELVYVRQLFYYWSYKNYKKYVTLVDLGKFVGGRDHTTVIHSCAKYQDRLDTDSPIKFTSPNKSITTREDYSLTIKYLQRCLSEYPVK